MIASEHYVYCDNSDCQAHSTVTLCESTITELRKQMREDGWGKVDGKDLCENCMDTRRKQRRGWVA